MPRGQIIARTTNTRLVVYQGRDPATGKRRYLNKTVHGERTSPEAELARLLSQIPPRPELTSILDIYLDWWLQSAVDGRLRAKTARDYRACSPATSGRNWVTSNSAGANRSTYNRWR